MKQPMLARTSLAQRPSKAQWITNEDSMTTNHDRDIELTDNELDAVSGGHHRNFDLELINFVFNAVQQTTVLGAKTAKSDVIGG